MANKNLTSCGLFWETLLHPCCSPRGWGRLVPAPQRNFFLPHCNFCGGTPPPSPPSSSQKSFPPFPPPPQCFRTFPSPLVPRFLALFFQKLMQLSPPLLGLTVFPPQPFYGSPRQFSCIFFPPRNFPPPNQPPK